MTLSGNEIRGGFIDFFKSKGHKFVPSSSLVPINDETLLFANAGMNQFKNIFLGFEQPAFRRAANSQKCLRVSGKHNDLEEVGKDTYHHTFFEMLGNWSFDDYFKAESIEWAWELLTKVWGINPDQLWASVFGGDKNDGLEPDEEAAQLWTKVTPIPKERVKYFGKKDNFWEMGNSGPCGPCSEIHIDLGAERCDKKDVPGHACGVNQGCSRFMELWNLVFIQYNRDESGKLSRLAAKYVDTGAGLERVTSALQGKRSNYDTDLFMPVIDFVSSLTGRKYTSVLGNQTDNSFRVIADHIRTLTFAITDGAVPSNDGRGYVIRRILRRASRFGRELGMHEPFMYKIVPVVVDMMSSAFPEIKEKADYVSQVINSEEAGFCRTLDRGMEIFAQAADKAAKQPEKIIGGEDAFQLYDTFGFPVDLTRLMAQERGLGVDETGFENLMEQQRQRARAAQKDTSLMLALSDVELPVTEDLHKYHVDKCHAQIVGFIENGSFDKSGKVTQNAEVGLVLDRTCFYAESGGQVGDCGTIESESGKFIVSSTTKIANCVIHRGKMAEGSLAAGEKVSAKVSHDRNSIKKNHTATHLLQWALQHVVGKSVAQQGSLVGPDYLRFDFTTPKALTAEQLTHVETLVRQKISEDAKVICTVMPKDQAMDIGAMALFGEKYGDEVRVVAIGTDESSAVTSAFSKEFCGGTHVDRLGIIGGFKIIKEESISAGVRRITALTGDGLGSYLEKRSETIDKLCELLKVPQDDVFTRIEKIVADNKKLAKELKSGTKSGASDTMEDVNALFEKCEKRGDSSIVIGKLSPTNSEQARAAVDMIKKKAKSCVAVFGFAEEDKVTLIAGVTDDLIKKGVKAGDIVKAIAPIVDGGGGGRPDMAQAGGKNVEKIDDALAKAKEIIFEKIK